MDAVSLLYLAGKKSIHFGLQGKEKAVINDSGASWDSKGRRKEFQGKPMIETQTV